MAEGDARTAGGEAAAEPSFSIEVGQRLRSVRRIRGPVARRRRAGVGRPLERLRRRRLRAGLPQPEPAAAARPGRRSTTCRWGCCWARRTWPGRPRPGPAGARPRRAAGGARGRVGAALPAVDHPRARRLQRPRPVGPARRPAGHLLAPAHRRDRHPRAARRRGARSSTGRTQPVRSVARAGGSVDRRVARRPEVRRHLRRRPRAHPRGRRPRRAHQAPRRRRRRGRQRHGQGDRRADPPGRRGVQGPARPGDGHAHHRRRAQGHRARSAWPCTTSACRPTASPAARPGSSPTAPTPTPRSSSSAPSGSSRRCGEGRTPVVGGAQGVSGDRNVTFLGRGGSDTTAVALAHALDADCVRALHRRARRVLGRPAPRARRPPHGHGQLRRDARDDRVRLPEAGHAVGRVRPHVGRAPAHPISVHLGAGHLGAGGGPVHGAGHRLGRRARHVRGQGHRHRRARPAGHRRAPVPAARRRRRERRHDRAEHVGPRRHRHLLHRPARGPRREPGDHLERWPAEIARHRRHERRAASRG